MGLKNQLLKVIEWKDPTDNVMVYRYTVADRYAIMKGSQLIVNESQATVFVFEGVVADVFGPGKYKLDTNNLPILTKLANWKYAFENPYKGDVYFVNTKQFTNLKWGTTNPIMMRDRDFGVIRLRGYGVYSIRVGDPVVFMRELFGTNKLYTVNQIEEYIKKILVSRISDVIAESKVAALDLAAKYDEISAAVQTFLTSDFDKLGLKLISFYIENLSLPAEVEKTMDERTSLGVLSDSMDNYARFQAAQAMRDAAKNPGGMAGAGMGLGAGITLGGVMTEAMAKQSAKAAAESCGKCGASVKAGAKFCPDCGAKLGSAVCGKCGAAVKASAKFCPDCGAPISAVKNCAACGKEMPASGKFCPHCGAKN
ncbi:MAG TPA: SPFH domain-containing protein [Eubacteriales bacterium]|nr:SPFH domain-containing protein [Eubacteriales bacterium]